MCEIIAGIVAVVFSIISCLLCQEALGAAFSGAALGLLLVFLFGRIYFLRTVRGVPLNVRQLKKRTLYMLQGKGEFHVLGVKTPVYLVKDDDNPAVAVVLPVRLSDEIDSFVVVYNFDQLGRRERKKGAIIAHSSQGVSTTKIVFSWDPETKQES